MSILSIFSGNGADKYKKLVPAINALEAKMSEFKDEDFPVKTGDFKARLAKGESLDDILPEAFALVREASKRVLGLRHYDVQFIGGMALHHGNIAEMRTGEGKTLVATLPVYLNALEGKGVHVVTVNDYLSKRDASWMGRLYSFLGLSLGVINSLNVSYVFDPNHKEEKENVGNEVFKVEYEFLKPCTRRESYACDITYGTNNEFGFDYLRDNLVQDARQLVQRGHNYAIVDEIDSILIDEARTPLIIAGEKGDSEKLYVQFADIANKLSFENDYTVDEKLRAISMTQDGITRAEKLLGIDNIYTEKGIKFVHHLETAVKAKALFIKDREYVVQSGEIVIVDTFTGRLQPGRRWNEGLHQAIEAKEGVEIKKETHAVASITFQNYFRFYKKLSGMTGTAETSKEEFQKVYNLDVVKVPTNVDTKRLDHNDLIFKTETGKWQALARHVKELNDKGQPVLIGTVSIEKNELLSAYLKGEGIPHTVLNAKNHENEGAIIAGAGKKGSVVVATNMAGRGIDIKLGGTNCTKEEEEEVKNLGGLFVVGTERHEARRIDNQLRGRAGRQGDPGATQFYVSLDDDLMRIFGGDKIKGLMNTFNFPDDMPIENSIISRSLENAQEKIEGFHFDSRKNTLEYDNVLNIQRNSVYKRRRTMLTSPIQDVKDAVYGLVKENEEANLILQNKEKEVGEENFWNAVRRIVLYTTDVLWTEHIESMDYLRSSVNLRAYGQHDPLIEYKKEGLHMFKEMENNFLNQTFELIKGLKGEEGQTLATPDESPKLTGEHVEPTIGAVVPSDKTIGRNDLCPCGSGKKYKKCHGA